jgi:hypothetical protein
VLWDMRVLPTTRVSSGGQPPALVPGYQTMPRKWIHLYRRACPAFLHFLLDGKCQVGDLSMVYFFPNSSLMPRVLRSHAAEIKTDDDGSWEFT